MHYKPHLKGDANDRTAVIIISIIIRSTDISLDNIFFFRPVLVHIVVPVHGCIDWMSRPISSRLIAANSNTLARSKFSIQILFSRQALMMIRNLLLYTKSQKLGRCVGFYSKVISRLFCFFLFFSSNSRGRSCAIYIKRCQVFFVVVAFLTLSGGLINFFFF